MKKALHWLDANLEEFILVILLIGMTVIMGIQVFSRYALGMSLSWSEELTRYLFIWCVSSVSAIAVKNAYPLRSNSLLPYFPDVEKQFSR